MEEILCFSIWNQEYLMHKAKYVNFKKKLLN